MTLFAVYLRRYKKNIASNIRTLNDVMERFQIKRPLPNPCNYLGELK
jgi:hypothetical protein